jgi:hypothetical protein
MSELEEQPVTETYDLENMPVANVRLVTFQVTGIEFNCPGCMKKASVMSPETASELQAGKYVFGKCEACGVVAKLQHSKVLSLSRK